MCFTNQMDDLTCMDHGRPYYKLHIVHPTPNYTKPSQWKPFAFVKCTMDFQMYVGHCIAWNALVSIHDEHDVP